MNGRTGKTIKFDRLDDAADIVETSYLLMGFLCVREYFNKETPREVYLRKRVNQMWGAPIGTGIQMDKTNCSGTGVQIMDLI
jgi:hypothetical protein